MSRTRPRWFPDTQRISSFVALFRPNYNSVWDYAELCSAAKIAACRRLSRIITSVPLAYGPILPITCNLARAPGLRCSAAPRRGVSGRPIPAGTAGDGGLPSSSWTVQMSCPPSSRCVAKEGRRVWGVARFAHPGATRRPFHHALADGLVQIGPLSTGPWMTRPARDHDHPCALPARVAVCPAHAALTTSLSREHHHRES